MAHPQFEWGMALARSIRWPGAGRILDAGCGSGRLTAELLNFSPEGKIVAVDIDASMVDKARRSLSAQIVKGRVEVHRADLLRFKLREPVDLIFSNAVFHWVLDHDALWAKCRRWLRPGGRLHAEFGGHGNLRPQLDLVERLGRHEDYAEAIGKVSRQVRYANVDETVAGLAAAGFTDIEASLEAKPTFFAEDEAFEAFARTVVLRPYRTALGPRLWDSFVGDWMRVQLEERGKYLDYVRLTISARSEEP